jgi:hypothetical protein
VPCLELNRFDFIEIDTPVAETPIRQLTTILAISAFEGLGLVIMLWT